MYSVYKLACFFVRGTWLALRGGVGGRRRGQKPQNVPHLLMQNYRRLNSKFEIHFSAPMMNLRPAKIRGSIVVSISACHAEDPSSIPGRGDYFRASDERRHSLVPCGHWRWSSSIRCRSRAAVPGKASSLARWFARVPVSRLRGGRGG